MSDEPKNNCDEENKKKREANPALYDESEPATEQAMKEKIISTQCSLKPGDFNQSVYYNQTIKLDDHKLRIKIRNDSYAFQSYAKVELWNGTKWNTVHSIMGQEMKSNAAYNQKATIKCFDQDRNELIRVAKEILSD